MNVYNGFSPQIILTDKGEKHINEVTVFDYVYDYFTGKRLSVRGIKNFDREGVYKVTFSDNREEYFRESELVYISGRLFKFTELLSYANNFDFPYYNKHLKLYPNAVVKYNDGLIIPDVEPDAYTAGAVLMYGDYDSEYINLPIDRPDSIEYIINKYKVEGASIDNNMVFFKWYGQSDDNLITWEEFFKKNFNGRIETEINRIPHTYMQSSEFNRWEFIRGAFDTGCLLSNDNYTISIFNKHEGRLKSLQKILWSLGILSFIEYDPSLSHSYIYRLDLTCDYSIIPDFFYDITKKEKVILNRFHIHNQPSYKIAIRKIELYDELFSKELILSSPNAIYLTSNFIPKYSITMES